MEGIFCRGCSPPAAPFKGSVDISEDGSEVTYSCEAGYSVRVGNWFGTSYVRRCMKHGEWEGYRTPICTSELYIFVFLIPLYGLSLLILHSFFPHPEFHYFIITSFLTSLFLISRAFLIGPEMLKCD